MMTTSPAAWFQRWRDALVVLVPVYLVVFLWDFFPAPYLVILCAGSGMTALVVLLLLLRRPFKSQDIVAPSGVSLNGLI
jgi:hypothetical protein